MAQESYRGRLVLSRADHPAPAIWRPYAEVMWQDDNGFHSHETIDADIIFDTETEAITYGFAAARSWIDREL